MLVDKTLTLTKGKFLLDSFYLKSNFFKLHTNLNKDDDPIENKDGVGVGVDGGEIDAERSRGIYESVTIQPINNRTSNTLQGFKRRANRVNTVDASVLPKNRLLETKSSLAKNSGLMNLLAHKKADHGG